MNYESVSLDKNLYLANGGFNAALEILDSSKQYTGTEVSCLDAFQRQLKRFGIQVSGENSDKVSKFFNCPSSAILFPEYVIRAVSKRSHTQSVLEEIIASKSVIHDLDYHAFNSTTRSTGITLPEIDGEVIPETIISSDDRPTTLRKRGRILNASYDAIKDQRLDVFSVALGQIGNTIFRLFMKDAIETLIGKKSQPGVAEIIPIRQSFEYRDIIGLWSKFGEFEMNMLIASPDMAADLITIDEFKPGDIGYSLHSMSTFHTSLGLSILKSDLVPKGMIIAIDKNFALEMLSTGCIAVEHEKLINKELSRSSITAICGFNKIFPDAVKILQRV